MERTIDFRKYRIKLPKSVRPNNRHYKKMLRKLRREFPQLYG